MLGALHRREVYQAFRWFVRTGIERVVVGPSAERVPTRRMLIDVARFSASLMASATLRRDGGPHEGRGEVRRGHGGGEMERGVRRGGRPPAGEHTNQLADESDDGLRRPATA